MNDATSTTPDEPTRPGWYASADTRLNDYLIFLLMEDVDVPGVFVRTGQWMAFTQSGEATECDWSYVAQVGPVAPLVRSGNLERLAARIDAAAEGHAGGFVRGIAAASAIVRAAAETSRRRSESLPGDPVGQPAAGTTPSEGSSTDGR